jgi:hypothetical protein
MTNVDKVGRPTGGTQAGRSNEGRDMDMRTASEPADRVVRAFVAAFAQLRSDLSAGRTPPRDPTMKISCRLNPCPLWSFG